MDADTIVVILEDCQYDVVLLKGYLAWRDSLEAIARYPHHFACLRIIRDRILSLA